MNFYLLEFAINSLLRQKGRIFFIIVIFSTLIFLLSTLLFISNSLKRELLLTSDSLPEIIIKKEIAGRTILIDEDLTDELVLIEGVSEVIPRVWGYYYSFSINSYLTIVGVEEFEPLWINSLTKVSEKINNNSIIVGEGVKRVFEKNFYKDYFNFFTPQNGVLKLKIGGVFRGETSLFSNDVIIMSKSNAKKVLGIDENRVTDIVLKIPNPLEIAVIASKIREKYPNLRVITKEDLKKSYQNLYNYKGGLFLSFFIISLATLFLIIYEKVNSITSNELREIGILRAIGWRIEDIIKEKIYESLIVSLFSYLLGIILSLYFVFILNAPLFKEIFLGNSLLEDNIKFHYYLDIQTLLLIFLLTVPIYLFASIIPAWRIAIKDIDEVIR